MFSKKAYQVTAGDVLAPPGGRGYLYVHQVREAQTPAVGFAAEVSAWSSGTWSRLSRPYMLPHDLEVTVVDGKLADELRAELGL